MIGALLIFAVFLTAMVVMAALAVFAANVTLHYIQKRRDATRPRRSLNK